MMMMMIMMMILLNASPCSYHRSRMIILICDFAQRRPHCGLLSSGRFCLRVDCVLQNTHYHVTINEGEAHASYYRRRC